jgi:hypothetical protein
MRRVRRGAVTRQLAWSRHSTGAAAAFAAVAAASAWAMFVLMFSCVCREQLGHMMIPTASSRHASSIILT